MIDLLVEQGTLFVLVATAFLLGYWYRGRQ